MRGDLKMNALTSFFGGGNNDPISPFDKIRHEDERGEFWWARELGEALGYGRFVEFRRVVEKARENATLCGLSPDDHMCQTTHLIASGKGAHLEVEDFRLSRRGAGLVAVNADGSKQNVADAKHYFVMRTRQAELAEQAWRDQGPTRVSETPWFRRVVYQRSAHAVLLSRYANTKFTVFSEAWQYLLEAEKIMLLHELRTLSSDLMDCSIGKRFANFFEKQTGKRNIERHDKVTVEIEGTGIPVNPLLWDLQYLPMFRQWLMDTYFPEGFIEYLNKKDSLEPCHEIAKASAADCVSKKFTGIPAKLKKNHREIIDSNGNQLITDSMAKRMIQPPKGECQCF